MVIEIWQFVTRCIIIIGTHTNVHYVSFFHHIDMVLDNKFETARTCICKNIQLSSNALYLYIYIINLLVFWLQIMSILCAILLSNNAFYGVNISSNYVLYLLLYFVIQFFFLCLMFDCNCCPRNMIVTQTLCLQCCVVKLFFFQLCLSIIICNTSLFTCNVCHD